MTPMILLNSEININCFTDILSAVDRKTCFPLSLVTEVVSM